MRILQRNGQMTFSKSSSTMFLNSSAGRANLDTKFPNPLAWVGVMMFALPATYPHSMIPKHSRRAGKSLSMDMEEEERAEESWSSSPYDGMELVLRLSVSIVLVLRRKLSEAVYVMSLLSSSLLGAVRRMKVKGRVAVVTFKQWPTLK